MKNDIVNMYAGGGGSPEQSHEVVSERQLSGNYEESSARRAKPRFRPQARALAFNAKGGEPASHGFTMAEILLSLTIIGVVAAITLPSLTGNINERTWNTQRKALYARFSQAIALMPALNGYGTLVEGNDSTSAVDTAAETFVTEGLSKVLKINNICDSEHLEDCGIPSKITPLDGGTANGGPLDLNNIKTLVGFNDMFNGTSVDPNNSASFTYRQLDTKAAAFETQNGESILTYYNPNCAGYVQQDSIAWHYTQSNMCANFVYDLNGSKGPNTVGKDIGFISVMYPTDSLVVAPVPLARNAGLATPMEALSLCKAQDPDSRLPNQSELISMFYNRKLLGIHWGYYNSGTVTMRNGVRTTWFVNLGTGHTGGGTAQDFYIRCVKR